MPAKTTKGPAPKKPAAKKAPVKKAPAKKARAEKAAAPVNTMKLTMQPRELFEKKAADRGETIESLIKERSVEVKPIEEYVGITQKVDFRNRPVIPGLFDLLIPPGTPRKLIIRLAKEYPVQLVRRDDIYVPVGVSDVERDLLAIRGDEKTVRKMEKILFREIEAYIDSKDAQRHDYSKPVRLEGIGPVERPPKAKSKAKAGTTKPRAKAKK